MTKKARPKTRAQINAERRARGRPLQDVGQHLRTLREAAGLTQAELAAKAKFPRNQCSYIEGGYNIEAQQYRAVAKALGFRGALEMFRARDSDPLRRHLDRAWDLLEPSQKKRALRRLNELLLED